MSRRLSFAADEVLRLVIKLLQCVTACVRPRPLVKRKSGLMSLRDTFARSFGAHTQPSTQTPGTPPIAAAAAMGASAVAVAASASVEREIAEAVMMLRAAAANENRPVRCQAE